MECIFTWYWLADLCAREGIDFVLGHALYMKAIHGGKAKNDRIDALKIATLLRGGMLPQAYVYPPEMRSTRDLLRRRLTLVRQRGQLLAHIQSTHHQYNLPTPKARINYRCNREGIAEQFSDPSVFESVSSDIELDGHYDLLIKDLELLLTRKAKVHDPTNFFRLRSIHGVGTVLAMTLLYETVPFQHLLASWLHAPAAPSRDWRLASSPTNNLRSQARLLPLLCPLPDPVSNEPELARGRSQSLGRYEGTHGFLVPQDARHPAPSTTAEPL